MTLTTDDLVKVEHPGDADIWHSFDIYIVNGEEAFSNSQLYWEESDGNLVALKAGNGRGLPLEGRVGYGYDCSTPYEFTSAWLQSDGKLRTFGNQADDDCSSYGNEAELILDPEKGYTVRTVEHRGGVKGNAGGGKKSKSWISQGSDDLFYYEKLYGLDINSDGFVGYIAPRLSPVIVDQGQYSSPLPIVLSDVDFVEVYQGTSQNDNLGWSNDFEEKSLLVKTIEGNDSVLSDGMIDLIAVDGGEGDDEISIYTPVEFSQDSTIIGGDGSDVITVENRRGSSIIRSGQGNDIIMAFANQLDISTDSGDDSVSTSSFLNGVIWLGDGNDEFTGGGSLEDAIIDSVDGIGITAFGENGDDVMNGERVILFGQEGDDDLTGFYINGGAGNDLLEGSIVELSEGSDTIAGFRYDQGNIIVVDANQYGKNLVFARDGNDVRILSESGINTLLENQFKDLPIDIQELQKSIYYLDGPGDLSGGENPEGGIGGSPDPDPEVPYELPETTRTVEGTNGKDKLRGKKSNDSILGLGGNDKLNGKKGDDILEGGDGNDTLKGAKGDDYLLGSQGVDVLIGGKGADVFKTSKGADVVNDFKLKQGDRVGLNQGTEYEVIDDVDGTLIRVSDDIRMLLLDQDYDKFLAAGNDTIARIAV